MTTDSRKLVVAPVVDATGAKAGFQEIKDSAKDMAQAVSKSGQDAAKGVDSVGDGAAAASAKVDRATSNLVGSIQRATAAAEAGKKSGSAFFESLAGQRGANLDTLKPYLTQLDAAIAKQKAAQDAMNATAPALQRVGVSAAQTANAMRGVPAQFTDIVTSLQGGQAPLTVFLQQGGQLKDMFGGIGPAAKALGGYVLGLINPLTVAAAAVGTLGVAFYHGAKESENFNKAIILTGNYLGTTVSQLQVYSKEIAKTVGTQGAAAEALSALANSGKVAKTSLTEVGTAVVYMNRVLGQSVDEATATFVKLADEPTKASAKLNESMHYLNLATYERIRALEEQGNKEAAAALAQKAFADETTSRLQKVEAGAGSLERGWRSLADGAKSAWDAMLGIGRTKSIGDALGEAQTKLNEARAQAAKGGAYAALYGPSVKKGEEEVAALSRSAINAQEKAAAEGEKARTNAAQIGASERIRIAAKEAQTNADMREKFKKQTLADYKLLGDAAFKTSSDGKTPEQVIADYNEKHKDPKAAGGSTKEYRDDAATKMLESLRQQEASLKEQLATDEKLTASEKERAKFTQLVADLKTKGTLTAEQKSLLAAQDTINAQLDQNVAVEKQLEAKKEAAKLDAQAKKDAEDLARTFNGINLAMESANESRRDQYERTLATVGLGRRARSEVESEFGLRKDEQRNIRLATKSASDKGLLDSDEYKDEVAKIRASADEARKDLQDFYAKDKANRENWVNGAREAFSNYADYASDAAAHTEEVFGNALKGIEDQFVNLFTGKKVDLKGLFDQTTSDLARSFVKENITGPLAKFGGDLLGDGGALSGLLGNSKTGNERGASASNPLYVRSADGFGPAANSSNFGSSSSSSGGGLAGVIGSIFGGMSNGAATTTANALPGDALDNLIKLQGGWGTIAGFANGGEPPVGRVSMVGERGPELFVPRQAGTIIPNGALGGGTVVNIHQAFPENASRKTIDQAAQQAANAMRRVQRNA